MERFRAITSSYYRRAQGIIVVYDVANRESFDALSKWFGDLDTYVSSAVAKIVVGNKVDRVRPFHIPRFLTTVAHHRLLPSCVWNISPTFSRLMLLGSSIGHHVLAAPNLLCHVLPS